MVHPDSGFFDRYHKQRGDRDVAVSPWQAHPVIGEVRELKFISPVSVRFPVMMPNLAAELHRVPEVPWSLNPNTFTPGLMLTLRSVRLVARGRRVLPSGPAEWEDFTFED